MTSYVYTFVEKDVHVVAADGILSLVSPGMTGVEIGVDSGVSSRRLIEHGCFMYLVDPYTDYSGQWGPPGL